MLSFFQSNKKYTCNISKALGQRTGSFSQEDVNTIITRMQGIISEGSDHIKELERKIKTQGKGKKLLT